MRQSELRVMIQNCECQVSSATRHLTLHQKKLSQRSQGPGMQRRGVCFVGPRFGMPGQTRGIYGAQGIGEATGFFRIVFGTADGQVQGFSLEGQWPQFVPGSIHLLKCAESSWPDKRA
jgi:hypothetical protein